MLVIKYPLSWSVAKRLREGDEVRYTGKIVYLSKEALIRMENYMKLEGRYPYDISGEIVYVKEISPIFVESIYKLGASAVLIDKNIPVDENTALMVKKYERPLFESEKITGEEIVKMYPDLGENALKEIWVESLPMKVAISKRSER